MGREMGSTMGREELNGFLTQRPVAGQGSASSQNQDLSALVCLLLEPLVRDRQHVRPSSSGIWRQGGERCRCSMPWQRRIKVLNGHGVGPRCFLSTRL
jgi:hypothetical protein